MRKVELGPAKKQQTKGGSANVKKYEALVEAKEQQVLQLQQELTATKTRLKMLESGKGGGAGGGGGKRPAAARRAGADGRLVRPRNACFVGSLRWERPSAACALLSAVLDGG